LREPWFVCRRSSLDGVRSSHDLWSCPLDCAHAPPRPGRISRVSRVSSLERLGPAGMGGGVKAVAAGASVSCEQRTAMVDGSSVSCEQGSLVSRRANGTCRCVKVTFRGAGLGRDLGFRAAVRDRFSCQRACFVSERSQLLPRETSLPRSSAKAGRVRTPREDRIVAEGERREVDADSVSSSDDR
jgi:hypothetical protein